MKKFRKLIPALALLLVSAVLMSTASYAWFSMNNKVTVTGMKVKAKAEGGLLVSATAQNNTWSNSATVLLGKEVQLLPASTSDGATWYHAHSKVSNTAVSFADGDGYYVLTNGSSDDVAPTGSAIASSGTLYTSEENLYSVGSSAAKIVFDENGESGYTVGTDDGFYLVTNYYLRSSGNAITVGNSEKYKALAINEVTIGTISGSAQLDQCLRIGVQIFNGSTPVSNFVVLAPVSGADGVAGADGEKKMTTKDTTDVAALVGLCSNSVSKYYANANLGLTAAIPENTSGNYLTARIFVWFEGEDSTCISDNLTTSLDTLSVNVSFKIVEVAGQYNDKSTLTEPTT